MSDEKSPLLKVVKGNPNEEELAAIIAVVASRGARVEAPASNFSLWARRSRLVRPAMRPGPGAWRGSTYPR